MSIEQELRAPDFLKRWLRVGLSSPLVDSLAAFPIFSGLTAREIETFGSYLERRDIDANVNLFLAGDPGVTMFLLEEGSVDILKPLPDGTERRLTQFTDRSFIGEIALLSEVTRTATARSATPCRMWLLYRDDFKRLCAIESQTGIKILWALASEMGMRMARTNEMVARLAMRSPS